MKVQIASMYLEGKALQWHFATIKKLDINDILLWEDYERLGMEHFGKYYDDPIAELISLRQTCSVSDYLEYFELILARLQASNIRFSLTSLFYKLLET